MSQPDKKHLPFFEEVLKRQAALRKLIVETCPLAPNQQEQTLRQAADERSPFAAPTPGSVAEMQSEVSPIAPSEAPRKRQGFRLFVRNG